jgi:GAF domain-containing protein
MLPGFKPIHPRTLYAKLLASASAQERAQAALDFLCGCTGSPRGYLFLERDQGFYTAADSGQGTAAADLVAEVKRVWSQELETEADSERTRTIDLPTHIRPDAALRDQLWKSAREAAYVRHVLGTYHGARWTLVGVAMLEAGAKLNPLRHAYIEVICNAFIAAGDVRVQPTDPASKSE